MLIIVFLVIGTLFNTALAYTASVVPYTPQSPVRVVNLKAEGPTALCPGETLDYSFRLVARQDAVVSLDSATYRVSDPEGVAAWADTRRTVLNAPTAATVQMRWFVPTRYWDWATGKEIEMQPGTYLRLVAVSTPSRGTVPSMQYLEFEVKGDCS